MVSAHPAVVAGSRGAGTTTRVLFIGGWGRSGSTLLERLVGSMDGTVSVGEMRDVWRRGVMGNRVCGCGAPFLSCPFWEALGG